jgi:hypothetical protein
MMSRPAVLLVAEAMARRAKDAAGAPQRVRLCAPLRRPGRAVDHVRTVRARIEVRMSLSRLHEHSSL